MPDLAAMQISAVIPSFNRAYSLERAVTSVLDQKSSVEEIILVDDGSTDRSCDDLVAKYPQLKLIKQSNQGVSAARNTGIAAAAYAWIALLDSDDSWLPNKIESIRRAQHQHPGYVLYHSDEIWVRNGKRVNQMNKHQKAGGWIFNQCLSLCAISPSAAVMQKSTIEDLGMFDPDLPACEDYDLWLRLCHRFPVYYIEQALITKFGGHADQLSQKYWGMDRFRIRSLNRLLEQESLTAENFAPAVATIVAKLGILLAGARKRENQQVLDEFKPLLQKWERQISEAMPC
ncbi:MAG: glycosyltransferase involved in cell wall biosynthesis [Planctomycetota bacterium]|jgi:glycosyltransferase involved in cell wall biosynthesis